MRKHLATLLALVMVVGLLSVPAMAEDGGPKDGFYWTDFHFEWDEEKDEEVPFIDYIHNEGDERITDETVVGHKGETNCIVLAKDGLLLKDKAQASVGDGSDDEIKVTLSTEIKGAEGLVIAKIKFKKWDTSRTITVGGTTIQLKCGAREYDVYDNPEGKGYPLTVWDYTDSGDPFYIVERSAAAGQGQSIVKNSAYIRGSGFGFDTQAVTFDYHWNEAGQYYDYITVTPHGVIERSGDLGIGFEYLNDGERGENSERRENQVWLWVNDRRPGLRWADGYDVDPIGEFHWNEDDMRSVMGWYVETDKISSFANRGLLMFWEAGKDPVLLTNHDAIEVLDAEKNPTDSAWLEYENGA